MLVSVDGYARTFTFVVTLADGVKVSLGCTRVNMYEVHLSWDIGRNAAISGEEVDPDCS